MDFAVNLQTIGQSCRVCLKKGDINIWDFKVKITSNAKQDIENTSAFIANTGMNIEKFIEPIEFLKIFNNTNDSLVLTHEFPMLCWECLEDFRLCYIFHEKIINSSIQLRKIYDECLNQCIEEEEHLLEPEEEIPEVYSTKEEQIDLDFAEHMPLSNGFNNLSSVQTTDNLQPIIMPNTKHLNAKHKLDKNSSIVVTQYIPSTMIESPLKIYDSSNQENDEEYQPPQNLHTVDCTTVEINDVQQLESLENSCLYEMDNHNPSTAPPVYICQYCPQAFAKSEFLKTHIQTNHVCKFCMQTFQHYVELCSHLRQHKEHKCVICLKVLSSQTNLRHHIKRIHQINLPPKMTLLDFIQTNEGEEEKEENKITEAFPEILMHQCDDDVNDALVDGERVLEDGNQQAGIFQPDSLENIIYITKVINVDDLIGDNIMKINN